METENKKLKAQKRFLEGIEVVVMKSILTVPKRKEFRNLNSSFAYIEGES